MRRLAIIATALALAACHGKQPETGKSAAAEVLPGSASDAMIAYDTLKSQPPMAAPGHSGASEADARPVPADDDAADAPADEPAAAPSGAEPAASVPAD